MAVLEVWSVNYGKQCKNIRTTYFMPFDVPVSGVTFFK